METETTNPSSSSPPLSEPAQKKPKLSPTTDAAGDANPSTDAVDEANPSTDAADKANPSTDKANPSTDAVDEANPSTDAADKANPSTTADPKKPRYKRRKVAIFFAYCGVGYQGMQKNPGAKTIEGDLEQALELAGAVPEPDIGHPKRWDWARSARTDKGVSAVGQVVSGRFYVDPPGFVDRLNSRLPEQIRIFGYKRVTPTFNAKKFCDRRRYVYLLPVFALDPNFRRDDLVVVGSDGLNQETAVSVDSEGVVQSDISSNTLPAMAVGENVTASEEETMVGSEDVVQPGISSNTKSAMEADESVIVSKEEDPQNVVQSGISSNTKSATDESEFRFGEKEKGRLNEILKRFEGTHNFHNFTTRTKAEDPSAKRYIVSFNANSTVTIEGMEFVRCEVVGQSFMLHQIRKMIGTAVAIMRGLASESIFDIAFQQDIRINVPMAPEVGLFLDECIFTSYNNWWGHTHEVVSMKAFAEQAEEFKMKHIYSHIARAEHKDAPVALWLHYLNRENYPDLCGTAADAPKSGDADA